MFHARKRGTPYPYFVFTGLLRTSTWKRGIAVPRFFFFIIMSFMGLGRTQKRKTMKKILLLLLCVLVNSTRLFAGDHVVNMTLTIGVPHTFTPIDDIGVPSSKVAHKNIWLPPRSPVYA